MLIIIEKIPKFDVGVCMLLFINLCFKLSNEVNRTLVRIGKYFFGWNHVL